MKTDLAHPSFYHSMIKQVMQSPDDFNYVGYKKHSYNATSGVLVAYGWINRTNDFAFYHITYKGNKFEYRGILAVEEIEYTNKRKKEINESLDYWLNNIK